METSLNPNEIEASTAIGPIGRISCPHPEDNGTTASMYEQLIK